MLLCSTKNGFAIHFVPNQTEEYCWMALRSPVAFLNEMMTSTSEGVYSIHFILKPTDEIIGYAIRTHIHSIGRIFAYIPEQFITEELILYGVELYPNNTDTIANVIPDELQTLRVAEAFIKQSPSTLRIIREDLKTAEPCQMAFDLDPTVLLFIPFVHQTQNMIDILLERKIVRGYMIDRIHPQFFSETFFLHVSCNIDPDVFVSYPDEFKTPFLCRTLVEHNPIYLEYVPDVFKTQEMCEAAVNRNRRIIAYVPDLWKAALHYTAVRILHLPFFHLNILQQNWSKLHYPILWMDLCMFLEMSKQRICANVRFNMIGHCFVFADLKQLIFANLQ